MFHLVIEFADLESAKEAASASGGKPIGIFDNATHQQVWGEPMLQLPELPKQEAGPVWNVGLSETAEATDSLSPRKE